MVDEMCRRFDHSPRAAGGVEVRTLAGERHQMLLDDRVDRCVLRLMALTAVA